MVKEINFQFQEKRVFEILKMLKESYPEARCSLLFKTPYQLLIATILSAQCTDERVNQVTPGLFQKFPDAQSMAQASLEEIEECIRSTNFYRNKAKSILSASQTLSKQYQGQPPQTLEELVQLQGVGRKTANVVLGVAYQIPGVVVDTHVKRLSYRIGLTNSLDPEIIEQDMMKLVPKKDWTYLGHLLIEHGRKICMARKPLCEKCILASHCMKRF